MYAASTGSTTSGSRLASVAADDRRVRVVRLLRPRRAAPAFGFSLRGGKEYATGFFISKVELNSEAHFQGLKVGDQLVSVNGYRVDDAIHSELVHYMSSQSRLKIKVRNVGMLPVKDKAHDSLSWQFVSERESLNSDVSSSPTLCLDTERTTDLRLSILVPPRAKLGCGICKGPDWKPGIFVQFVREGGIAREAGLRPGDQILSCNGQDFTNTTFNEAISVMKVSGRLELVVREGAGAELVSPESSGYNSSASSAAGERSPAPPSAVPLAPPAALRRRLASVAEEAADRADRLTTCRLKRRTWDSLDFDWKNGDIHNFDAPSDIEPDYDCPSIPNNPHTFESKNNFRNNSKTDFITSPSNRTIINLTEDGATIQCSYDNQSPRKSTFSATQTNGDKDKKTIVVEVHHTNNNASVKPRCNYATNLKNDSNSDTCSISSSATLSSAIAEEIQRRKQNKKKPNEEIAKEVVIKPIPPKVAPKLNEKKKQHDALMDEFKKVHRKMFASQETNGLEETDKENNLDRQQTLPLRKLEQTPAEKTNGHIPLQKKKDADIPPTPPPMPTSNGNINGDSKKLENLKPIAKSQDVDLVKPFNIRNGTLTRTPTPDYSKIEPPEAFKNNVKDEKAELVSIDSYKMKNPTNYQPKPPSNYFLRAPNGTATMKKHVRPISVTIGEYGNMGGHRKEPSKLDFLNSDKPDGPHIDDEVSISNRLQSELALTLSRSNLRKKTEVFDHAFAKELKAYSGDSDSSLDKNFHARYSNYLHPMPPSVSIPKVSMLKHNKAVV